MKKGLSLLVLLLLVGFLLSQSLLAQEVCVGNLCVKKDAVGTLVPKWTWTIDKSADQTDLLLAAGQAFQVNYAVTVEASMAVTGWDVSGLISVRNRGTTPITITSVVDTLDNGQNAVVSCSKTLPYDLPGTHTMVCTYVASGTSPMPSNNTATVNDLVSDTVAIIPELADVSDSCVDVTDDLYGPLGTVCAGDTTTRTFEYSLTLGLYPDCEFFEEVCNVASFITNDIPPETGSDDRCVNVETAPCEGGCTLTPGYWKTHSKYGPAPYDDTWEMLASGDVDGEDQRFFGSGQTWYQVAWTPPKGGSAYYILAHAYIATVLNHLNEAASTDEVDEALGFAQSFLLTHEPANRPDKTMSQMAKMYAGILDDYNNGLFGPGHCSEEEGPSEEAPKPNKPKKSKKQ